MSSNVSLVITQRLFFCFLSVKSPVDLKFIHQIVNCLSAGNSFITKFSPTFLADQYFV
jgi:hypothetical protein